MPVFSFQVRTGDDVAALTTTFEFHDSEHAIDVARLAIVERAFLEVEATKFSESILEIVDEDGDLVTSLPIADVLTRH